MANSKSSNLSPLLAGTVETSQGSYKVLVGRGILHLLGEAIADADLTGRGFIISDPEIFPSTTRAVHETLETAGIQTQVLVLPSTSWRKTLETVGTAYKWLASHNAERGDFILALGGGVTGDVAGFTAATWLRGVPFVQVPTTLSAMVDASIGGKTGVNTSFGKNMVGAFHQPKLVFQDINFLSTLPKRELRAGWAEAIKHGLILDADLTKTMENHSQEIASMNGDEVERVIRRSVSIKARVVSSDEFERGETRMLLNYGHTIGHALEAASGFDEFLHGEAVSIGMMAAAAISADMGVINEDVVERQRNLLLKYDLPVTFPNTLSVDAVVRATLHDKKRAKGKQRWVLLEEVGRASIFDNVPSRLVEKAVRSTMKRV